MLRCECCSSMVGVKSRKLTHIPKMLKGVSGTSNLCKSCAAQGHFREFCLTCDKATWYCQREEHIRLEHPALMLARDKVVDLVPARKEAYSIGTLRYDL